MDKQVEGFLFEAIELARYSVGHGGGPFGAVIVYDGEVVGRGHNRVTLDNDPTAHAEVGAIRDACRALGRFELSGATLYVSCEPCPMCMAAAYWARLDAIVYSARAVDAARAGFDDTFIAGQLALPRAERQLPTRRVELPEAQAVFRLWLDKADRIDY